LLAGLASMGVAIFVLSYGLLFPSTDSPIEWNLVALRLGPLYVMGAALVLGALRSAGKRKT
jgi:hypothetical protein